jgi:hypothetical protein
MRGSSSSIRRSCLFRSGRSVGRSRKWHVRCVRNNDHGAKIMGRTQVTVVAPAAALSYPLFTNHQSARRIRYDRHPNEREKNGAIWAGAIEYTRFLSPGLGQGNIADPGRPYISWNCLSLFLLLPMRVLHCCWWSIVVVVVVVAIRQHYWFSSVPLFSFQVL